MNTLVRFNRKGILNEMYTDPCSKQSAFVFKKALQIASDQVCAVGD